jgi:signal transduction histidine kinase
MERRIRELDWSRTRLGPQEGWPASLKTAVRIMLDSRYPMFVWWGEELVNIYNDAYAPVLGGRHPEALGRPAREVWSEIWTTIGPQSELVMRERRATWNEEFQFVMERNGFPEEAFFTYSYSPIPDDDGGVGGLFCACTEETQRVLGRRRLRLLRALAERAVEAKTIEGACESAVSTLSENPNDVPFALLYLLEPNGTRARLAGASGLEPSHPASPATVELGGDGDLWEFARVALTGDSVLVDELGARFGRLPGGVWPESPKHAIVLPMVKAGEKLRPTGFVVAGISPRLPFHDDYRGFLGLVAGQIGTAVANARVYEEERRRAEALARLDEAKTLFFSNVSHEFRTPLTLMLGPVEDILDRPADEVTPEIRRLLEIVRRNGSRLLRLVNTLLDFARIEAGRARATYRPTPLGMLTTDLASLFRSAVERAGLRLTVDCPEPPEPVFVDHDMWEKIVLNLLSNAFKFTLEGEIAIELRASAGNVELSVRDTGTGIPAKEMPRLFERFHRVKDAGGRTHEGSGIGLALVQELVKLHGGEVRAESQVRRGTTFRVVLPLGAAHLPPDQIEADAVSASPPRSAHVFVEEALSWLPDDESGPVVEALELPQGVEPLDDTTSSRRARVLVADDNADMRQYVSRLLGGRYRVDAVPDGVEALDLALRRAPDLILADVMMPRLDGFGLLRELRSDPGTRDLPIILLSARAGEESRIEGLEAGADDYLVKPFAAKELLARVAAHIHIARIRRESAREQRRLRADAEAAKGRLEDADRRKDEFLATLAHELRNPLAPLSSGLQIMKLIGNDGEAFERSRAMMERQLDQLVRLVDDLLDVSRISRGKIELRREAVDLSTVIRQAVETSLPLIQGNGHTLQVQIPSRGIPLHADVTRLSQVFSNLLNNAATHSEREGHIAVIGETLGDEVIVRVRDTGVGIAPEALPSIFEMFTQGETPVERSHRGLGIGLSLVKALVEMHGGSVQARSEGRGRGSEFEVRLPLAPAELAETPAHDRRGAAPRPSRRILVVDDSRDAAAGLASLLGLMGNDTRAAYDGVEAIRVGSTFHPHVVVLDIGMPKLNGYQAARRIRQEPWGKDVVLVALTGWGQEEDRRRAREAGFQFHVVKPATPASIEKMLASLPTVVA